MRWIGACAFWLLGVSAATADIDRLMAALKFPEVIDILIAEERTHNAGMPEAFFPEREVDNWQEVVDGIHRPERALEILRREMAAEFGDYNLSALISYYESAPAQGILSLETSARAAFSDSSLVEALRADLDATTEARPQLFEQVADYIEMNDLVGSNVTASYLSNVAFAAGLIDGGQFAGMTPQSLAAEMWAGDESAIADTQSWLVAFMMTAYGPADSADLQAYINQSLTPDGSILNDAINRAFQRLFAETSFEMGQAVAFFMGGDEI